MADQPGASSGAMKSWRVPVEDGLSDTRFTARVEPADLQARALQDGGLVDFEVVVSGDAGESSTWTTARVAYVGSELGWVDPVETSDMVGEKANSLRARGRLGAAVAEVPDVLARVPKNADVGVQLAQFPPMRGPRRSHTTSKLSATNEGAAATACQYPYWEYTDTIRERDATIGTTYPVGDDKARAKVVSSQGASYGMAASGASAYAGFKVSGSRFVQDAWEKDWLYGKAQRSYQVGVDYQLMRKKCHGSGTLSGSLFIWRPIGETGGNGSTEGLTRPNWTNCVGSDPGPWRRKSSEGKAYEYGSSVKMTGLIGIDLSIKRNYSNSQMLEYNLTKRRRICGNNDRPSRAGKVMAKFL